MEYLDNEARDGEAGNGERIVSVARSPVGVAGRIALVAICLAPYLASYPVPALHFHVLRGDEKIMRGYEVAMLGWVTLLQPNLAWLANLLFVPSLAFMLARLWRAAAVMAALAALCGLHTLQLFTQTISSDSNMGRESPMLLSRLEPGFYLWMASFGLVVVASLSCWLREPKPGA